MKTGISPNYVSGWTAQMALREITQNYLDARDEFSCKGYIRWANDQAILRDYGPGLEPRHLALGVSEKSSSAKGKYGEGLKLALLVMARNDRFIEVHSLGRKIVPYIHYDEDYGTDLLHFEISESAFAGPGTEVRVACSKEELQEAKSYFIEFIKETRNEFSWVDRNAVSLPGGRVYVNGTDVGALDGAIFSYHFSEDIAENLGNRDRTVIDHSNALQAMRTIVGMSSGKVWRTLATLLLDEDNDQRSPELLSGPHWYAIPTNNEEVVKKAITSVISPKKYVLHSNNVANSNAERQGFKVLHCGYGWEDVLHNCGVLYANQVTNDVRLEDYLVRVQELTTQERKNLDRAMSLVKKHYADPGKILICKEMPLTAENYTRTVAGACDIKTGQIYLLREILESRYRTLHVLLHETVHKESKASDLTEEFERAWCDIAVDLLEQLERVTA